MTAYRTDISSPLLGRPPRMEPDLLRSPPTHDGRSGCWGNSLPSVSERRLARSRANAKRYAGIIAEALCVSGPPSGQGCLRRDQARERGPPAPAPATARTRRNEDELATSEAGRDGRIRSRSIEHPIRTPRRFKAAALQILVIAVSTLGGRLGSGSERRHRLGVDARARRRRVMLECHLAHTSTGRQCGEKSCDGRNPNSLFHELSLAPGQRLNGARFP